jgi:hypothetical protein
VMVLLIDEDIVMIAPGRLMSSIAANAALHRRESSRPWSNCGFHHDDSSADFAHGCQDLLELGFHSRELTR